MTIYNHTTFTSEQIDAMPVLGRVRSNWRQRNIVIHQHPTDPALVVSVGTTFDQTMQVVCVDKLTDWPTLDPERIVVTN